MNSKNNFIKIKYNGVDYHFYNERETSADDIFWIETSFKWQEFLLKYDFNIFILKSNPKTNIKINFLWKSDVDFFWQLENNRIQDWLNNPNKQESTFNEYYLKTNDKKYVSVIDKIKNNYYTPEKFIKANVGVNKHDLNTIELSELQSEDLYYLYKNMLYEVLYVIPKIDENNFYYYDFIVIINKNQNLQKILDYNFNLININSVVPINIEQINPEFIESLIPLTQSRFNDTGYKEELYRWNNDRKYPEYYLLEEVLKSKNSTNFEITKIKYDLLNKIKKNFDQNLYAKTIFRNICTQIYSFDSTPCKVYDKGIMRYSYKYKYDLNFTFATDYFEIMGAVSVKKNENEEYIFNDENISFSGMSESYGRLNIGERSFCKEFIINGYINWENAE